MMTLPALARHVYVASVVLAYANYVHSVDRHHPPASKLQTPQLLELLLQLNVSYPHAMHMLN